MKKGPGSEVKTGNIVRMIFMDVSPSKEHDFLRWYQEEHEPLLRSVKGVLWTYKGINEGNRGQKYFYLYLHENPQVQLTPEYLAASQTDWAKSVRPSLRNFEAASFSMAASGRW